MTKHGTTMRAWPLAMAVVAVIGSCTVAFDLSSMQEGCATGTKLCNGQCVPIDDTATGCAESSCTPCAYARGTVKCNDEGKCEGTGCLDPWANCDGDAGDAAVNGCETNIKTSADHCLKCDRPACNTLPPNVAKAACLGDRAIGDTCGIAQCEPGYGDCDHDAGTGCEVNLRSRSAHCGECEQRCQTDEVCLDGGCVESGAPTSSLDAG